MSRTVIEFDEVKVSAFPLDTDRPHSMRLSAGVVVPVPAMFTRKVATPLVALMAQEFGVLLTLARSLAGVAVRISVSSAVGADAGETKP